jgi:hypothetical protein
MADVRSLLRLNRQYGSAEEGPKNSDGKSAEIGVMVHRSSTTLTMSTASQPPSRSVVTFTTIPGCEIRQSDPAARQDHFCPIPAHESSAAL